MSVEEARELVGAGHTYLDVRTPEEFMSGHVSGAVNIPYMVKAGGGMSRNDSFVAQVSEQFSKDEALLLACQGGVRSAKAAVELEEAGFTALSDMLGGYMAWKQRGFPSV